MSVKEYLNKEDALRLIGLTCGCANVVIPGSFLQKWCKELQMQSPSSGSVIMTSPDTLGWKVLSSFVESFGYLHVISNCCSLANRRVRRVVMGIGVLWHGAM